MVRGCDRSVYNVEMGTEGEGGHEERWSRSTNRTVNSRRVSTHVDSNTLPAKSTSSTNAVNVIFTVSAHEAMGQ